MATIRSGKILNAIGTDENVRNYNSILKMFWSPYLEEQVRLYREFKIIDDNISFHYSGEDWLDKCDISDYNYNLLTSRGYQFITQESYSHADFNSLNSFETITKGFKVDRGDEFIDFFDGAYNHDLSFLFEDNLIVFYNKARREILFELSFEEDIEVKDMIVQEQFIHLYVKYKDYYYVILTHFGMEFANKETKWKDIKCFYKIKLSYDNWGEIAKYDSNCYYFIDSNLNKKKAILGKNYFFINGEDYFFTHSDLFNELKYITTEEDIQVEHLFLYDLVGLYGLSGYLDENQNKLISTRTISKRDELFKFKFDDTLNGMVNFNDFSKPKKSYKVDFNDGKFIKIFGNLFYENFQQGEHKLIINSKDVKLTGNNSAVIRCRLLRYNGLSYERIKDITTSFYGNRLYFSNLCVEINGTFSKNFEYEIDINITDDFPVDLLNKTYNLDITFDDNPKNYEYKLQNNMIITSSNRLKNPIKIDYNCDDFVSTNEFFVFNKEGELDKTQIKTPYLKEQIFEKISNESTSNIYVNYDKKFEDEITIFSEYKRKDIFNIERLKFSLRISS